MLDEVHLMVGPEAVGEGTPVFDTPVRLRLLGVRQFHGSDNVVLRYGASRRERRLTPGRPTRRLCVVESRSVEPRRLFARTR
jgi:hypothetical protein